MPATIMYISKCFEDDAGASMHYRAIKEMYGEENIYTIDLRPLASCRKEHYIAYGKYCCVPERFKRWAQGNMMFISNKIIADICRIIKENNIQIVYIDDSVFGNLVKQIKREFPNVSVITFYLDVKGYLYPQWIKNKKRWIDTIEFSIGIQQEKVNAQYADVNIVFNQREADIFEKLYNKKPSGMIGLPALVPQVDLSKPIMQNDRPTFLFVGKKYYPNIDGLRWFYREVLPGLPQNIIIKLVGRGLECLKEEFSDERIDVVGGVESLVEYYRTADAVISPLFEGGGMKTKIVEAVSFGKCIVATDESLCGFWEAMGSDIRNKSVYCCNTCDEWIECMTKLAECVPNQFNKDVFDLFLKEFSYEAAREKLRKFFV